MVVDDGSPLRTTVVPACASGDGPDGSRETSRLIDGQQPGAAALRQRGGSEAAVDRQRPLPDVVSVLLQVTAELIVAGPTFVAIVAAPLKFTVPPEEMV